MNHMAEELSENTEEWVTGKKKKMRSVILILLISIILISSYFIITIDGHPETPEAVLTEYAECINCGDANGAYEMTTVLFTHRFDEFVEDGDWMYSLQFNPYNIVARYSSDMNATEIEEMEEHKNKTEPLYNVIIEDYCLIDYRSSLQSSTGEM